ncbi:glycoside hydrolase family 3 protein [Ulvibacterium marinum]|uniref:beta-glucosidase n=1 Tax=Ulvibacterium marinum TaxID=2419782 RepID=A0A3B0BTX4_9FLAO|nr:glycoside hydrolase family 3 N-terminal domain-containing protein [Ulvibacterium marinum]RKN76743.1 glycoside hydrolase family 3 protein [Ulvibacterium marinum]
MKKFLKITGFILAGLILILLLIYLVFTIKWHRESAANMELAGDEAPVLTANGYQFRDLNKNGKLDVYEDSRAPLEKRVENLISQMNLDEKAGLMFAHFLGMEQDGSLLEIPTFSDPFSFMTESTSGTILKKKMNHVQNLGGASAKVYATWNNNLQKFAERTRLGIPVTLISDPRHGTMAMPGASAEAKWISVWPSQLGLGAIGDTVLVREFGDIARQEYLALGIRLAQHPMADIATDPRWARINGTFGEDARLSAALTKAYIQGFQGDSLGPQSVACQTKHFAGGGPQEDGWDAHFKSGKGQAYPGDNFDYHLIPFTEGAFMANTAQIMPYYGVPKGQVKEEVGFSFSREMIQELLRDSLKFDGVVATDWGIISDMVVKDASAWGVEHLSEKERVKKVLDAGCDVFGGEYVTEHIIDLVETGEVSEERIDISIRRILRDKFRLGLFDNPYVDLDGVDIVGNPGFVRKGREAQRKSLVLLKNEGKLLPLSANTKIYLEGMEQKGLNEKFPQIVEDIDEADIIVQKLETPSSPPEGGSLLERLIPQGRLDFPKDEKEEILERTRSKPTITVLTIQRPPVIPEINAASKAVIADFECEDDIILELIFGKFNPSGKLPIEIPSSVEAVEKQLEDVPYDSENPLYPYGHGLSYSY